MFFIFPLSHESSKVQRIPYVTITLVAMNVLIFGITLFVAPSSQKQLMSKKSEIISFLTKNAGIDFPEQTMAKLPPELRDFNHQMGKVFPGIDLLGGSGGKNPDAEKDTVTEEERMEKTQILEELIAELNQATENEFYHKYGYVPARGGIGSLLTSMFIHGGFFHLLFNMFFLFLTGCNIEDLWGRIVFPVFYVLGGIVATWIHGWMHPDSTLPCIGASGAIAAVMGAFLIRLGKTKIYFLLIWAWSIKIKKTNFWAPAYIMLPLWLLSQLWNAWLSSHDPQGGGVAFWAHIGGFGFGVLVAMGIRFFQLEEKILAPAIEEQTKAKDSGCSSGIRKLCENDLDGAVSDLRNALVSDPGNPIAHSALSEAYFRQGKTKVAQLEHGRAIRAFLKLNDMEQAIGEFLEKQHQFSEVRLPPDLLVSLGQLMESQERYEDAIVAYRVIYTQYRKSVMDTSAQHAMDALERMGMIYMQQLNDPSMANKIWTTLLKSDLPIPPNRKQIILNYQKQLRKSGRPDKKHREQLPKPSPQNLPSLPMGQRIKLVENVKGKGKYPVQSVTPLPANKVLPLPDGLDLRIPNEPPVAYDRINMMCIFQLASDLDIQVVDLFVRGKSRPYRIHSSQIPFHRFLNQVDSHGVENFKRFILFMISRIDQLYLDKPSIIYLKTGKIHRFEHPEDVALHEKSIWSHLIGEIRCRCLHCGSIYWINGNRIPPTGAKASCKKCGRPISIVL